MLDKPPETKDVLRLIKDTSASWNELGSELDVPFNDRESLGRDIRLCDNNRLEYVLTNWIRNKTKEVKWRVILEALEALKRKDLIKKVIAYLDKPETYSKYILMDDFSPSRFSLYPKS